MTGLRYKTRKASRASARDLVQYTTERFEITNFWNKLIDLSIAEEWETQQNKRKEEWDSLTQLQKDRKKQQKRARLEKAHREKLKWHPPEEKVEGYTEDGELPSFEEGDL